MTKRTLGGSKLKAIKVIGFRARMITSNGRKNLANLRKRGRKLLTNLRRTK
jgi:ribosomal protein L34